MQVSGDAGPGDAGTSSSPAVTGQYAVCRIQVEPLPRGDGFEFVDNIVGGAIPGAFVSSVEKGVRTQIARDFRLARVCPAVSVVCSVIGRSVRLPKISSSTAPRATVGPEI